MTAEFAELEAKLTEVTSKKKESLARTKASKTCLGELGMSMGYNEEQEQLKLDIKQGVEEWRALGVESFYCSSGRD